MDIQSELQNCDYCIRYYLYPYGHYAAISIYLLNDEHLYCEIRDMHCNFNMFGKYDENTEDTDRFAVMLIKLPVDYKEKLYEIIICIFDTITDYFVNYGFWDKDLSKEIGEPSEEATRSVCPLPDASTTFPASLLSSSVLRTYDDSSYYTDHLVIYNNEILFFVGSNSLSCDNIDLLKVTKKSSQNIIDEWSEFQDDPVVIRGEIVNNNKIELHYDYPVVSICASKHYYKKTRGAKDPSEYFVEDRHFE